jgi:hypothetical protein
VRNSRESNSTLPATSAKSCIRRASTRRDNLQIKKSFKNVKSHLGISTALVNHRPLHRVALDTSCVHAPTALAPFYEVFPFIFNGLQFGPPVAFPSSAGQHTR